MTSTLAPPPPPTSPIDPPRLTRPRYPVPARIKWNTLWIALSQMFGGAGTNLTFALGPLMVVALLGSSALAGLSVAIHSFSRFVGAYPFGRITDRYGRKPGLLLGLAVALVGTLLIGLSMNARSFPGLLLGLLVFGIGSNAVQQLRLAAAEMYLPEKRATVVGLVLSVALVGVVVAPALVSLGESIARGSGMDPLAVPWLLVPILIVPAILLISQVHPDPREIAVNLPRYYPGYVPAHPPAARDGAQPFGVREFLADPQRRLGGIAMFAAQGSMQIAMVTTPLVMHHHGASLPVITLSMAIHAAGMFAPSIPMGALADRIGRRSVLLIGTVVEAIGGGVTVATGDYSVITLGIFLVGLGWCAANVASTAIVVDSTPPAVRGRAMGVLDSQAAIAGLVFSLGAGPLAELAGLGATGILAMLLMLPPAVMLLSRRGLAASPRAA